MDRSGHTHAQQLYLRGRTPRYSLNRGLFGQQFPSGRFAVQINFFSPSGFEPKEPRHYTRKYRILILKYNKYSHFKGISQHLACEIFRLFKITALFVHGNLKRVRVSKQSFWIAIKDYGIVAVWLPDFNYSESSHAQIIAMVITGFFISYRSSPNSLKRVVFLYFVDRASRYRFLVITNLTHFFVYLFICFISLHV